MTTSPSKLIVIPPVRETAQSQTMKKQLRVAAYCRVSTDDEEQLTSYEAQMSYYTDKITSKVDCILTHCAPTSIQQKLDRNYSPDRLTDFLQMVKRMSQFDYWFLGHYHRNCVVDDRFIVQWEQMVELQSMSIV